MYRRQLDGASGSSSWRDVRQQASRHRLLHQKLEHRQQGLQQVRLREEEPTGDGPSSLPFGPAGASCLYM